MVIGTARIGAALATDRSTATAARSATEQALHALDGRSPRLAVVFASPHHASAAGEVVDVVNDVASPEHLVGCVAESVVGGAREVEGEPAVSVWLADLPRPVETFH